MPLTGCKQQPWRTLLPQRAPAAAAGLLLRSPRGVQGGVSRPKVPTEFCLVPELPLGATGKVSRRRLRELAMAAG